MKKEKIIKLLIEHDLVKKKNLSRTDIAIYQNMVKKGEEIPEKIYCEENEIDISFADFYEIEEMYTEEETDLLIRLESITYLKKITSLLTYFFVLSILSILFGIIFIIYFFFA
jgi:hypothetical protein